MRLFTSTFFILALLLSNSTYAGSANIVLDCKSKAQTEATLYLQAQLPGDHADFDLQLRQAQRSLNWDMSNSELSIDVAMRKKKFSFELVHQNGERIKLSALPASIKSKGNNRRLFDADFSAEVGFTTPQKDRAWPTSILVHCQASHHI